MTSERFEGAIPERGFRFLGGEVRRKKAFDRAEVEAALTGYFALAEAAAKSGDWNAWANQFTDDAIYVEHTYGVYRGREEIRSWVIKATGAVPIDVRMDDEWHLIDNDMCVVYASNWHSAPDNGAPYQFNAIAILCYAGDGKWCYEEDIYNAVEAKQVMEAFGAAKASR